MRTLQRFATVCFLGAAVAALAAGCSSSDSPGPSNSAGSPGSAGASAAGAPAAGAPAAGASAAGAPAAGAPGMTGDATKGAAAYAKAGCNACHGTNGEGMLGPNITGSKSAGIGNWSEAEFLNAVRNGKSKGGAMLCFLMNPTPATAAGASDADVADMFAFLKTKTNDTAMPGSYCMGSGCTTCTSTH